MANSGPWPCLGYSSESGWRSSQIYKLPLQLVMGASPRIPGELVGTALSQDKNIQTLVDRLRTNAAQPPKQTSHHSQPKPYLPEEMATATHVYIRKGKQSPLGPTFEGPFMITDRPSSSTIQVQVGNFANGTPRLELHTGTMPKLLISEQNPTPSTKQNSEENHWFRNEKLSTYSTVLFRRPTIQKRKGTSCFQCSKRATLPHTDPRNARRTPDNNASFSRQPITARAPFSPPNHSAAATPNIGNVNLPLWSARKFKLSSSSSIGAGAMTPARARKTRPHRFPRGHRRQARPRRGSHKRKRAPTRYETSAIVYLLILPLKPSDMRLYLPLSTIPTCFYY